MRVQARGWVKWSVWRSKGQHPGLSRRQAVSSGLLGTEAETGVGMEARGAPSVCGAEPQNRSGVQGQGAVRSWSVCWRPGIGLCL